MPKTILEAFDIQKRFGGLVALDALNFSIAEGSITAVIGPNGAGKSTLINVITGLTAPDRGGITLQGKIITGKKNHEIAHLGISRTFQTAQIFGNMTVLENVMVGRHTRTRAGMFSAAFTLRHARREEKAICEQALSYLDLVGLKGMASVMASQVPIGTQRLLEIARALAAEPDVLLLDEPAAGLNTQETRSLGELITAIKGKGTTVIIVEHDMELVMDIADDIMVLNFGKKIAWGSPVEIQSNQEVIEVYLGKDE